MYLNLCQSTVIHPSLALFLKVDYCRLEVTVDGKKLRQMI